MTFQFKPGDCIRLTWNAGHEQLSAIGDLRAVGTDEIEFDEVTNPGEVYSNISGAPTYKRHQIKLVDVVSARLY